MNAQETVIASAFKYPTAASQIEQTVALHMQQAVKREGHRKVLPPDPPVVVSYEAARQLRTEVRRFVQANQNCTVEDVRNALGGTRKQIESAVSRAVTQRQINSKLVKNVRRLYTGAYKGED
jgi:hypothetical protein